jgi:hypothetical protein
VNSYLPGLRSIPRARRFLLDPQARCALAITRSGVGADLRGVRRTMTGSDDDAPAARGPPLGARARRPEGRESSRGVLLIFQHCPASPAAQFAATARNTLSRLGSQ